MKKLLVTLVIATMLVSMFALVACGGDKTTTDGTTENANKLASVANIKYSTEGYKITWDAVANADSYNIKVTSEDITQNSIKNNEFAYYPKDITKPIKVEVQAVDSTGNYSTSAWSSETTITFEDKSPLMTSVMSFAKTEVNGNLTGFVVAYPRTDLHGDKHVRMLFMSKLNGKDMINIVNGDVPADVDSTSLDAIAKAGIETYFPSNLYVVTDDKDKIVNSMDSLLNSDLNGTGLKSNYINKGYTISVVSSYTALDEGDTAGKNTTVCAVVKATKGEDEKYLYVEYDCRVNDLASSIVQNVTTGLTHNRYLKEEVIIELSGDFLETAKVSANVAK